jgi:hypothetical protein
MIATLVVWAVIVIVVTTVAVDAVRPSPLQVAFSLLVVMALVVGATAVISRFPMIGTLLAATLLGSGMGVVFLLLLILGYSATDSSDPDSEANLIFAVLTLLVLALFVVGAAKLIRDAPIIGTLGLALGVVAVVLGLFWLRGVLTRFDPGPPLDRSSWESEVGIGPQIDDPAFVRNVSKAAGASATVAVGIAVFDAPAGRHAAAVSIQADDVLTYLGRRHDRIMDTLEQSNVRSWFLEVYDEDRDRVYQRASYAHQRFTTGWARPDIYECFFMTGFGNHGPPCPIDFSN